MKHYEQIELLESAYLPGEVPEQSAHLAVCDECRGRLAQLRSALHSSAAALTSTIEEMPDSFWSRQRMTIERDVRSASRHHSAAVRRFALAASLVATMSGAVWYELASRPVHPVAVPQVVSTSPESRIDAVPAEEDAWQSEQLSDFHEVVNWEQWQGNDANRGGT